MKICRFCQCTHEDNAWIFNSYDWLCEDCTKLKNLSRLHDMSILVSSLEEIFVRQQRPIENRIKRLKEEEQPSKPITRSDEKKKTTKM
tara:strand:+ start:76 stop:339 length:264 start_codon:yes stop_codon:yes gene_type:complete